MALTTMTDGHIKRCAFFHTPRSSRPRTPTSGGSGVCPILGGLINEYERAA
jgi:hypothetical protein